jgi:hypothetical protein
VPYGTFDSYGTWDAPATGTGLATAPSLPTSPALGTAGESGMLVLFAWTGLLEHRFAFPYAAESAEIAELLQYFEPSYGLVRVA